MCQQVMQPDVIVTLSCHLHALFVTRDQHRRLLPRLNSWEEHHVS